MTDDVGYDETLHLTAGQLRAMNVPVPDDIPDCGWVPRSAIVFESGSVDDDGFKMDVSFTEPFKWFKFTFVVGDEDGGRR